MSLVDAVALQSSLRGVTVLDASRYAPGPFCTLVCAALGADVIKLEPPGVGDPLRALDADAFLRLNAGKKSLTLDWRSEDGRDALRRLASRVDVFVDGFRPGVTARLGLDYETLTRASPSLVYLSITGYGQTGPYRDRAGHDVNYMAVAGALGRAVSPPVIQVADFAAGGLFAVIGILAALLGRNSSGRGCHLDLAMHHGLSSLMMLASGDAADRLSGRYPNYTLYRTRDDRTLSVGALEPKFWERFCSAIGRSDLARRMADAGAREEVATIIERETLAHWTERFRGIDACVEPVLSPEEARRHPQALHRHPGNEGEGFRLPFGASADAAPPESAPRLGEHTDEILASIGYSESDVAGLRSRGLC
jgi:alpha-methylacyl-CoA racemase